MDAINRTTRADFPATDGHQDIGAQDARQGANTGYLRRVLTVSLTLAVLAMVGAWLWFYRPAPVSLAARPTTSQTPGTLAPNTMPTPVPAKPVSGQ
jgi:hypothetical protein